MANPKFHVGSEAELSRRDLLRGVSAGVVASLGTAFLSGCGGTNQPTGSGSGALSPASMPKGFSREELTRRWQRVREKMREQRLDCLITPRQAENNADIRYLTDTPMAGWVVFPLEGSPIALFGSERDALFDVSKRDWGIDVRWGSWRGQWSNAVIETLREVGMAQARIGVGSLSGVLRNAEGGVSYTTFDKILRAFPRATFESAAEMLMRVKLVHSQEEIAVFQKVSDVSELGLQALMEVARPDVNHRDAWVHVYQVMFAASGEVPSRLSFRAGGEANTGQGRALDEVMRAGQIVNQEIGATVLGIRSQVNQSFLLGSPAPADWPSAAQYCIDLYHSMVDWITPGKSFKDLTEFYRQKVQQRAGGNVRVGGVTIHTGGWGDGPRLGAGRTEGLDDLLIEAGMIFTMKPSVPIRDTSPSAQFGDAVVVTENGARRLGKRRLEVITFGA